MSQPLRTTAALLGLLPTAVAVLTVPTPALMALVGLGAAVGIIAGAGVALVQGDTAHAGPTGWTAAGAATEAGLATAGVLVTLGPASVAVLPVLFLLVGLAWWADGSDRARAMILSEPTR